MPLITYGFWGARDCIMVGSSFVLPDIIGGALHQKCGINSTDSVRIAQIACPVSSQFLAGPAHFLALDFYNRPMNDVPLRTMIYERGILLSKNFTSLVSARIARIAPVYGIGGVGNTYFRNEWREYLIRREVQVAIQQQNIKEQRESATKLVDLVHAKERAQKAAGRIGWFRGM